ncbi:microtubule associated protein-domain-containing protein [Dunaliella salina]|uniref:Microtubule associated protein-domain-containing protein n=1 Tax=Dunaliella salina TaxID=3046 RepID=A0ABQ7G427_DUNSA|nr:microtubule associated protein-domain-containing protein [Dunaliella salina]|eukprot:KAF5829368.1 microtubule associated protein-domain-containing protein [Dunaliella salina]
MCFALQVIHTTRAAEQAWTRAVEHAEGKRDVLMQKLNDARKEVAKIKAQLGDGEGPSTGEEQAEAMTCATTLKGACDQANHVLLEWQTRKASRLSKYEAHQFQNHVLRQQLGLPPCTAKADISKAGLDFMEMERQRLSAEKDRRLACLYSELARLEAVCAEVGEDIRGAAAEVHPSYRNLRTSSLSSTDSQTVDDLLGNIDLSEGAFSRLTAKIMEMHALKEKRESQLQQLQDVLYSAWDAMGILEGAAERAALAHLLDGPERLHASTKDMAFSEVRRLEECESSKMKELALFKARQLQSACAATHIPVPRYCAVISECLAKVVRSLAEVYAVVDRRRVLVDAVSRMEFIKAESDWLREFESDENRYKGRDASARLTRSLKAQKLRDSIPEATEALKHQLEEWTAVEGMPFLYDGHDYMAVLLNLQDAYHADQAEKAAALRSRHQPKDTSGKNGTPQKAHPPSPAKSGRPQNAKPSAQTPSGRGPVGQQALFGRAPSAAQNGTHTSPGSLSARLPPSGSLSSRSMYAPTAVRAAPAVATPPPAGHCGCLSGASTPARPRTPTSDGSLAPAYPTPLSSARGSDVFGDRRRPEDGKVDVLWSKGSDRDVGGDDACSSTKRGKDQNQGLVSPSPVKAVSRIPRPTLAMQ